jgi:hypothetical protein
MHHHYSDITDKLGPPLWYDEHAVPRYVQFAPEETANIYAAQCALVEIACQGCGIGFLVAMSWDYMKRREPLAKRVVDRSIHFGDPPNTGCCAGTTMNCIDKRVIEFWVRTKKGFEWKRIKALEINLEEPMAQT